MHMYIYVYICTPIQHTQHYGVLVSSNKLLAITNYCKLNGPKQHKSLFLYLWRAGFKVGSARLKSR